MENRMRNIVQEVAQIDAPFVGGLPAAGTIITLKKMVAIFTG
ncbi:hypothetical protein NIASO_16840 [Niabella soli DSM 19437]|uniref:Uncharacterized protein n=1 Tax=Niabella soli DSM 19437 TaxID=929713 RepID=W0F4C4_9BACT|nr:hypothetical protein NIASO_16840 [Niabella soli DSM 19437]